MDEITVTASVGEDPERPALSLRLESEPRKGAVLTVYPVGGGAVPVRIDRRCALVLLLIYRSRVEPYPDLDNPGKIGAKLLWWQYVSVTRGTPSKRAVSQYVSRLNQVVRVALTAALGKAAALRQQALVLPGFCLSANTLQLSEKLQRAGLKNDRALAALFEFRDEVRAI